MTPPRPPAPSLSPRLAPGRPPGPRPRVSVVMPVYNTQRYVAGAVGSILSQTFTDLELIVVDDGSTDGSGPILDRLAATDPRLVLIRRPNTGYTLALQDALAVARAPLIARMDSDDVAQPTRIEKQLAYLKAQPEVALVGTGWTVVTPDGKRRASDPANRRIWRAGPDAIAARLAQGHNCLAHPSVVFRRAAFDAAGGYDPSYEPAEDFECWLRLSRTHRLACLPEPLLDYRIHPQSTSATRGHASVASVARAVRAHWAATAPPTVAQRRTLHRHLALLHYGNRDNANARAQARQALRLDRLSPAAWWWHAKLHARLLKGPRY